ncbi:Steroid receptor RNA activator 1 [Lamellibrachia satsuma]|nr:Steroid receptor RNA activator 1 [Lamellibrachia satsuma]
MAQPTRPGNHERGWNDPPIFLASHPLSKPPQVAPPRRNPLLTKRVAHPDLCQTQPMQAAFTSANSADLTPQVPAVGNIVLLPPAGSTNVPKFTAPIIVPAMSPTDPNCLNNTGTAAPVGVATNPINNTLVNTAEDEDGTPDFDNDDQLLNFVSSRLWRVLKDCGTSMQPRVTQEVSKKLDVLFEMWHGGQISYPVKSTMARLATALHRRRCDQAHQLHLALMMDYVSEVAAWMVGIKRLIQEARNVDPPLSPTSIATNTVPLATDSCDMPAIIPTRVDSSQSDSDAKTDAEMVEETEKANSCLIDLVFSSICKENRHIALLLLATWPAPVSTALTAVLAATGVALEVQPTAGPMVINAVAMKLPVPWQDDLDTWFYEGKFRQVRMGRRLAGVSTIQGALANFNVAQEEGLVNLASLSRQISRLTMGSKNSMPAGWTS